MNADNRAADLVRGSVVYRVADSALTRVVAAWPGSRCAREWATVTPADRVRFWAVVAIAASLTTLLTSPFGTTPRPLAWLLPALAGVMATLVLVLSPRGGGSRAV